MSNRETGSLHRFSANEIDNRAQRNWFIFTAMRRLLVLTLLFITFSLQAQDAEADSLKQVLNHQVQDTNRVNTLLRLAWIIRNDDPVAATSYSNQAVALASKLNYQKGKAAGLSTLGVIQYRQGNLTAATDYHQQALHIREQIGDDNGVARSEINLGNIYTDLHDTAQAMAYYMHALNILEKSNDIERQAIVCLDIGGLYLAENNNELAGVFCNRTYQLGLKLDDNLLQAQALNNAGVAYQNLGSNDSAMWAYSTSYQLATDLNDKVMMVDAGQNVGNVYRSRKEYAEAIRWHNDMVVLAEEMGYVQGLADLYQQLAADYQASGNYKLAYEAQVKFKNYSDSIYNEDNATRMADLTSKLESERKDLEVRRLELELSNENQLKRQGKLFVIAGLIIFALVAAVIVVALITRSNRKRDRLIIEGQQAQLNQRYWENRTKAP